MLEETVWKYALQNAVKYGKASVGPVMGKIMGEFPEERKRAGEVKAVVESILNEVNSLSAEEQKQKLEDVAPELLERKKKVERENILPELEGGERGVVMRFAPGPSGPLHVGHTRAALLNHEYVKKYGGEYVLRLEDTNPTKIDPEAYDTIPQDMKWLGISMDKIVSQSSRFDLYYKEARELLDQGHAYVCRCPAEEWRAGKLAKKACVHRPLALEENIETWEKMLSGDFGEGEATMVVKTSLDDPNPALRDFACFRIVLSPHPITGSKYCVYPLYNFSVAVDDHHMGMTHVLRGKDHLNNTLRQKHIYKYRGWKEPHFLHYGWVSMDESILKTSIIKEGISSGEFTGWDDVRLGTLQTLARRGISSDALRRYWLDVGIKQVDIVFSWDTLYSFNRDIVDPVSQRFFFVCDPVEFRVDSESPLSSRSPRHPDNPDMGTRNTEVAPGDAVFLQQRDASLLGQGDMVRLKDLGNFVIEDDRLIYSGNDLGVLKKKNVGIVHWAHGVTSKDFKVLLPDGKEDHGLVESSAVGVRGVVQFERYGFVNLISWDGGGLGAFAHK